jgi:hypothetical protein
MRKLLIAATGAAALAFASGASAATIVVGATSGIGSTTTNNTNPLQSTVTWTTNTFPSGNFSGWLEFTNDTLGLYQVVVSTSTPGAIIGSASLDGTGGGLPHLGSITGNLTNSLTLGPISPVAAGAYRFTFGGSAPATGGVVTGNLTFQLIPVPEPATWAMMLVGFAGIGFAMRRRRQPVLAQVA